MDQKGLVKQPVHVEAYLSAELGQSRDVIVSIFCGAVAGVVAKTAVAPVERVKMRYQISSDKFTLTKGFQYGRDIIKKGGIMSLWKGHSTTVIRVAPLAGISFAAHDYVELEFKEYLKTDTLPFIYKFLAGSIGGAIGTFFTYPLDVIRVRLALTPGSNWSSVLQKQGGFYQGLTPTMLGIIPYSGTAWVVKQTLHEKFVSSNERVPILIESLAMNAIAGLSGQFVTYPLDVTRRRMQMAVRGADGNIPTLSSTIRNLLETEGIRGLAKGFSLNIIKGPITLSLSLTIYDLLMKKMNKPII